MNPHAKVRLEHTVQTTVFLIQSTVFSECKGTREYFKLTQEGSGQKKQNTGDNLTENREHNKV